MSNNFYNKINTNSFIKKNIIYHYLINNLYNFKIIYIFFIHLLYNEFY